MNTPHFQGKRFSLQNRSLGLSSGLGLWWVFASYLPPVSLLSALLLLCSTELPDQHDHVLLADHMLLLSTRHLQ